MVDIMSKKGQAMDRRIFISLLSRVPFVGAALATPTLVESAPAAPIPPVTPLPFKEPSQVISGLVKRPTSVRLGPLQQEAALLSYPQLEGESREVWRNRAFGIYARNLVEVRRWQGNINADS